MSFFKKELDNAKRSFDGINFDEIYDTNNNLILRKNEDGTYVSTEFYDNQS
jgi:hypothetical protein